jgi:hypothetical protein
LKETAHVGQGDGYYPDWKEWVMFSHWPTGQTSLSNPWFLKGNERHYRQLVAGNRGNQDDCPTMGGVRGVSPLAMDRANPDIENVREVLKSQFTRLFVEPPVIFNTADNGGRFEHVRRHDVAA